MDLHKAFIPGQRDKNSVADKGMARYIAEWDQNWEAFSGDNCSQGNMPHAIVTLYPYLCQL